MANTPKRDTPYQVRTFEIIDRAVDAWDAIFEKDRPKVKMDAFNIGVNTTYESRQQHRDNLLLSLKNRDIPKPVSEPVPVFEQKQQMTVKMFNGRFVKIDTLIDSTQVGKEIVESTFKMNVIDTDEIDPNFFKSNSFVFNGEVYHRVSEKELESEEYKKPRIKKPKSIRLIEDDTQPFTHSQTPTSNEDFVDLYEDAALDGERYGVPYAITMAQGILESRGGRSGMAIALNNLFGIKCNGGRCQKQGCKHGYYTDDRTNETFERHASYEASFKRHIKFFLDNDRYNKCLQCGTNDIECWLYRLQKSGYATDKMYDYKLAEIINRYKLTTKPIRYDRKNLK